MSQPKSFLCRACWVRFASVYHHPTLGTVCPVCLRPMVPSKKKKRSRAKSAVVYVTRRATATLIAERDGWICWLCGEPVNPLSTSRHRPSVDHVVRRRDGGRRDPGNLRLAHQSCNEYREGANVVPFAPPLVSVGEFGQGQQSAEGDQ